MWRNTRQRYGFVAIGLHWLVAVLVLGLFILGLWMVDLTYYDQWYRSAPTIHQSVGVLLFILMVLRFLWRMINPQPMLEPTLSRFEQRAPVRAAVLRRAQRLPDLHRRRASS